MLRLLLIQAKREKNFADKTWQLHQLRLVNSGSKYNKDEGEKKKKLADILNPRKIQVIFSEYSFNSNTSTFSKGKCVWK